LGFIFTMFHFSLNLIFHTHTSHSGAYAMPCVALV
jgi:hypothetical protein